MNTPKIQALGLTRWSYPFRTQDFRRGNSDLDALRARLYAPSRLDHRLFLLEHVVLPGLRRQTDTDFTHIFLIGDQLPEPWRSRLLALLETVPQIVPVFHPEGRKHQELCREVMLNRIDPDCEVTAQYRLDDDDGVGVGFIEKTRCLFREMQTLFATDGCMALDYTRGFILQSSAKDITMRPVSMRFWAPGMVIFQKAESKRALMDFNHLKIWHYMPTLTWQDEPMFVRGAHHDNDSDLPSFGRRTRGFAFKHRNPTRYLRRLFGIRLDDMRQIWNLRKRHFMAGNDSPTVHIRKLNLAA